MEYYMVSRALKSNFQKELPLLAMKTSAAAAQQYFLDDNNMYNNSNVEDFSVVDCFFDFSNNSAGDFKENNINTNLSSSSFNNNNNIQEPHDHEEEEEEKDDSDHDNNSNISTTFDDSFLSGGLSVPSDDLAELEWVSHFVDDTSSEFSLYPVKSENFHARNHFQPEQPKLVVVTKPSSCLFPVKIPAKPRTKRTRPTGRKWSVEFILTDSSNSCSYSSSSSSPVSSSGSTPWLFTVQGYAEPPMKKPKKKPAFQTGGIMGPNQFQRRCSHCQVQKTPQWRTGPLGAKTLCNACGVRFKSGRLFPEYRPACSPTFSSEIHSNSHRKVLEIRKKKEVEPTSELSRMVPSF